MSEDLYAKVDNTKKVRFQADEKKDGNTDVSDNTDNVVIYDNFWAEGTTPPQPEDTKTEDHMQSAVAVKGRPWRSAAVFLVLLCLLLLTGLITLAVIFTKGNSDWKVLFHNTYNSLTMEKDQLLASNKKLTEERDQLLTSNKNLSKERDQLLTSNKNLTEERDQLLTSNKNLTEERDQLLTSNKNLTEERDQLQTGYNSLTEEQQQLKVRFNVTSKERDDLHRMLQELDWEYFSGNFYHISSSEKTWQDSRSYCQRKRADLVIINSKEEQIFLIGFNKAAWIGLTDMKTEGTWKWVDETQLTTSFWNNGEPNGSREENCAEIRRMDPDKSWNDAGCDKKRRCICEKTLA